MKTKFLYFISAMLAIASIAMVSCKKDSQENSSNKIERSFYEPPKIDDYDAYLCAFKERILGTRSSETMSLEEASWHLSSIANRDFGNINTVVSDFYYDTLYGSVNVTDGQVTLSDLGQAYVDIAFSIDSLFQRLDLDNRHIRFVDASIAENGLVTLPLTITYTAWDHFWFYPDSSYADSLCQLFFTTGGYYPANSTGLNAVQNALNLTVSHPVGSMPGSTVYYVVTRSQNFYYEDYTDPYGSPFVDDSRLYASIDIYAANMSFDVLCYCLDSYLALGYQYLSMEESIIDWTLSFHKGGHGKLPKVGNHEMDVRYGRMVANEQGGL